MREQAANRSLLFPVPYSLFPALVAVLMMVGSAGAATYYVAPNGKTDGDGSAGRPWPSVAYALQKVGGGQTIVLEPGTYLGGLTIPRTCTGTSANPTVIQAQKKWQARLVGADVHGIYTSDHCDWVIIDGVEVSGARLDGIKLSGQHSTVRNCWSHNNGGMGIASHARNYNTFERNLVEFNGQNPQFHHGMYIDGDSLVIRDNIVRNNAGFGLHLYPEISHSKIYNNLVYGHWFQTGIIIACPKNGGHNVVTNNTVVDNRRGIVIWNGKGEVIANNILCTPSEDPIQPDSGTTHTYADYNLCNPASAIMGPHCITGDPLFVDPGKMCYWLKAGSPAIGKGTPEYRSPTDFWGNKFLNATAPDLGCFPYSPYLTTPAARSTWWNGWPYQFAPIAGEDLPDLWVPPPDVNRASLPQSQ